MDLMREGTLEGALGLQAGDGAHELNLVAGLARCAARSNRQGCSPRSQR